MREKNLIWREKARERNRLHETLKSLEIWDEHVSVILRFLDSHKLSRPGVQVLRSYIRVLVLLTRYRCLIGENRQDSTESSKNANLASQVVVMQFPSSSSILKIMLYLPRHYKQEQQMATTEVQCNLIAYFFHETGNFPSFWQRQKWRYEPLWTTGCSQSFR